MRRLSRIKALKRVSAQLMAWRFELKTTKTCWRECPRSACSDETRRLRRWAGAESSPVDAVAKVSDPPRSDEAPEDQRHADGNAAHH
jgi:hypothetical protein